MQLPLSLCRAECAAGSTGPPAIFLAFRRVLNGLYVDPVAPIDAPRDFAENEAGNCPFFVIGSAAPARAGPTAPSGDGNVCGR
jgi:hypothetical protein